jgi:hypothetical protein
MKQEIVNHLKNQYGQDISLASLEDRNYCFDIYANDRNVNFSIEYKERFFTSPKGKDLLDELDILVELIQSTPYLQKIDISMPQRIDPYDVNIAIGWFYKCNADRLIYFRYLDGALYDVIDIDFRLFKPWFMNNIKTFDIIYSAKTTGTINALVDVMKIPKPFGKYTKYHHD